MPSAEEVQRELAKAKSMDDLKIKDFCPPVCQDDRDGVEKRTEWRAEWWSVRGEGWGQPEWALFEESADVCGRNEPTGNAGSEGGIGPQVVKKYVANTSELGDEIIGMYASWFG